MNDIAHESRRRFFEVCSLFLTVLLLLFLSRVESSLFTLSERLSSHEEFFSQIAYFSLINLNVIMILLLSFLIFRLVTKLLIERRRGILGSRLKTRLVFTFAFFALAPTILFFYVSVRFITSSFDSWFSQKVHLTMERTREAGSMVYKHDQKRLQSLARMAIDMVHFSGQREVFDRSASSFYPSKLKSFALEHGLSAIKLIQRNGALVWESPRPSAAAYPMQMAPSTMEVFAWFLANPESHSTSRLLDEVGQDVVRGYAPIYDPEVGKLLGVLITEVRFESQIQKSIEKIIDDFAALKPGAQMIRMSYMILMVVMTLLVVFCAIWLGFYVAKKVTGPLQSLSEATREIALGNYNIHLEKKSNDETGRLVEAFNLMAEDLRYHEKRNEEAQKAAAWKEVARRVAHEIKNPLTPIKLSAERLERKFSEHFKDHKEKEIFVNGMRTILTQVDSLSQLISEFSQFARMPGAEFRVEPINDVAEGIMNMFSGTDPRVQFFLEKDPSNPKALLDIKQMERVFVNLFVNAIDAFKGQGGQIHIRTSTTGERHLIEISDNGPGIPAHLRDKVLEPYFSTKPHGTGLGLSIVKQIILDHKGELRIRENVPRGTTIIIDLPKG